MYYWIFLADDQRFQIKSLITISSYIVWANIRLLEEISALVCTLKTTLSAPGAGAFVANYLPHPRGVSMYLFELP